MGHGAAVQLVVRWLTTSIASRSAGSRSLPSSDGSTPSITWGATGPVSAIFAPRCSAIASMRSPYQGGTNPSVSGAAYSARARLR